MIDLDSQTELEKYDKGKIATSIRLLPDQMEQAWEEVKNLELPKSCYMVRNVVIAGMGGSALGGRVVDSFMDDRGRLPIEIINSYNLPGYVNEKTLVLVSSYSGNTEETLSMAQEAVDKKAQIIGVSTGGKLAKYLTKEKQTLYKINPIANPSGQPRMGLGYSIATTIAVLYKCKFIKISDEEFYKLVVAARGFVKEFDLDVKNDENLAKNVSKKLYNKAIVIITSSHLRGVTHAFKNQLNENSKAFSTLFELPELNHHILEGLKYPKKSREILHFLLFDSDLYHKRIIKRLKLTADVIEKNGHEHSIYKARSETKLSQIIEVLIFGSFVSLYLAANYGVNAQEIPWVDYFKKRLAE